MKKTLFLKLLATKKLRVDDGKIEFGDLDLNLLPSIFISTLIDQYSSDDRLKELYYISWLWGYETVNGVKTELGLTKPEEIYDMGMKFAESMGIGLYKTHDYYPGKYTRFKIQKNPFLKHIDTSKINENIDYVISGAMAGGGSHVHEEICHTVELRCQANGEEVCEFVTGTKEELKERGLWEEADDLYNLEEKEFIVEDIFNNYDSKDESYFIDLLTNHNNSR